MTETANAPGKGLLKGTGILNIISGIFSIIMAIVVSLAGTVIAIDGTYDDGGLIILSGIFSLIVGLWRLIVGILGVKHCENLEKAGMLKGLAMIAIIAAVISIVLSLVGGGFSWWDLFGLLFPILFFTGAQKNVNALNA